MHAHDACTSHHDVSDDEAAPADGAHDVRAPQTAPEDHTPHDDAARALASTASAPQQLPQVTEQAGSAEAKTAGETPSSDRGMPTADGAASALDLPPHVSTASYFVLGGAHYVGYYI